ncbi:hypothetical protein EUTSA_v10001148mg [Eutrema salsugineum]|uniref:Terpene synthase metal-binding domain-containing protein n=1 Tax=Eutrema salsugineum TaxID=72664 RepID=V4KNU0_EUTSA|nr:hypothetical protein EUTSA_v10001148mg [Eutrema salsugineum]
MCSIFKEDDEKFKRSQIGDCKGMLSFYEALHFRTTTDYILDEALSFTLSHLEQIASGNLASPQHISKLIQNALHIPQHRNIEILIAREYISFYEQEENHDDSVLKLGKLNYKFLQLHYYQELKTITMWWRGLDHTSKLPPKFRERTIESWLWALMMYFEPQFSLRRNLSAKLYLAITFLDDACDTYGSVDEAANLVDCLERWNPGCMGKLQGHMKTAFKFVMSVYKEYEEIIRSLGRSFVLEEMIEEFKIIARKNLELVKWARKFDHMPSFDKYIRTSRAAIVKAILRTHSTIYYIKQHGVTKEEVNKYFDKMIRDLNKIVNEECLKTTHMISRRVLTQVINYGRSLDVLFNSRLCRH